MTFLPARYFRLVLFQAKLFMDLYRKVGRPASLPVVYWTAFTSCGLKAMEGLRTGKLWWTGKAFLLSWTGFGNFFTEFLTSQTFEVSENASNQTSKFFLLRIYHVNECKLRLRDWSGYAAGNWSGKPDPCQRQGKAPKISSVRTIIRNFSDYRSGAGFSAFQ